MGGGGHSRSDSARQRGSALAFSPDQLHGIHVASNKNCACALTHSKASLEMRAVPTWVDKVHDRDKAEQWYF